MTHANVQLNSVEQVRDFVLRTLCQQNDLEMDMFPATERVLVRREHAVGLQFCLHGPRNVRLMAIWEFDQHSILFYGSSGQRLGRVRLKRAARLAEELKTVALAG
ncbi:MAG: hypothetical protein JNK57_22460 [Planctomycetaceae bacterium]|nr:hypothetical protein [Planctomycetaceae bacterium]